MKPISLVTAPVHSAYANNGFIGAQGKIDEIIASLSLIRRDMVHCDGLVHAKQLCKDVNVVVGAVNKMVYLTQKGAIKRLLKGKKFQEITRRNWMVKVGDEMTRDRDSEAVWSPVADSMIGGLASNLSHFDGWRIRRPV